MRSWYPSATLRPRKPRLKAGCRPAMEDPPWDPHPRFCDTCGLCVRADAFDDHVKGKKHRRK
eukprot:3710241-Lingulodinium_polyedra.AAC.1